MGDHLYNLWVKLRDSRQLPGFLQTSWVPEGTGDPPGPLAHIFHNFLYQSSQFESFLFFGTTTVLTNTSINVIGLEVPKDHCPSWAKARCRSKRHNAEKMGDNTMGQNVNWMSVLVRCANGWKTLKHFNGKSYSVDVRGSWKIFWAVAIVID